MKIRQAAAQALPMYAVVATRRARTLRRAAMPTSAWHSLSPAWNERVIAAKFDCLPPIPLSSDDAVVDVGAHVGDWAGAVMHLLRPRRLIAFEPTPESFARLARRFSGRPAVDVRRFAVGAGDGTETLNLFSRSEFNSLLPVLDGVPSLYGGFSQVGRVEVPVTSLDDALVEVEKVSILHLDAQGFEPQVIRGASRLLARTAVVITVIDFVAHYLGEALFAERNAQMADHGFTLHDFGYQSHDQQGRLLWAAAAYRHA